MATGRLRISKQLEKSTTPRSIVITDNSNEQNYLAPGANGNVLTVVSNIPTWEPISFPTEFKRFANIAALPSVGSLDAIYYTVAESALLVWNGSSYTSVSNNFQFIVSAAFGANQVVSSGNTLSIVGLANSGITTTASATDIITIGINRLKEYFTPIALVTNIVASQIPIPSTLDVYRNGILQEITVDYSLSGSTVTLTEAIGSSNGAQLSEIIVLKYNFS